MRLENKQLQSLYDSIDFMTPEGVRTLGAMLDMGRPSLPDDKFAYSLKENIQLEIYAHEKFRKLFGDPRWGR